MRLYNERIRFHALAVAARLREGSHLPASFRPGAGAGHLRLAPDRSHGAAGRDRQRRPRQAGGGNDRLPRRPAPAILLDYAFWDDFYQAATVKHDQGMARPQHRLRGARARRSAGARSGDAAGLRVLAGREPHLGRGGCDPGRVPRPLPAGRRAHRRRNRAPPATWPSETSWRSSASPASAPTNSRTWTRSWSRATWRSCKSSAMTGSPRCGGAGPT